MSQNQGASPAQAAATAAPSEIVASPVPVPTPAPLPRTTRAPVPTPSLKPGEVITWLKLERPRFPIGQIIVSSFAIVGLAIAFAIAAGIILGHFRSRRGDTPGTRGLGLR